MKTFIAYLEFLIMGRKSKATRKAEEAKIKAEKAKSKAQAELKAYKDLIQAGWRPKD